MFDLPGTPMTTTVVGACMLSALMVVKDTILDYSKVAEKGLAAEAKKRRRPASTSAPPRAASPSAARRTRRLRRRRWRACPTCWPTTWRCTPSCPRATRRASRSSSRPAPPRACVCGGADGRRRGHQAPDCATPAGSAAAAPSTTTPTRPATEPTDRGEARELPMRVTLEGLDVAHASAKAKASPRTRPRSSASRPRMTRATRPGAAGPRR